jgi:hypothetical protein
MPKAFEFSRLVFKNWRAQIPRSYLTTDFSELQQELLKIRQLLKLSQGRSPKLTNLLILFLMSNSLL